MIGGGMIFIEGTRVINLLASLKDAVMRTPEDTGVITREGDPGFGSRTQLHANMIDAPARHARTLDRLMSDPTVRAYAHTRVAPYVSDRVFEGTRTLSPERVALLVANRARIARPEETGH